MCGAPPAKTMLGVGRGCFEVDNADKQQWGDILSSSGPGFGDCGGKAVILDIGIHSLTAE